LRDIILSNYKIEHGLFYRLRCYLELCKFKIAAFSSLSAATGFVLANSKLDSLALTAFFGILILACGACALNQYKDNNFYISAFHTMNIFIFVIMILLNFDRLLLNLS
jgi:heme O synthase-like polyprenyltransferase